MLSMILKIICSKTEHLQFGSVHGLAENASFRKAVVFGFCLAKEKKHFSGFADVKLITYSQQRP